VAVVMGNSKNLARYIKKSSKKRSKYPGLPDYIDDDTKYTFIPAFMVGFFL